MDTKFTFTMDSDADNYSPEFGLKGGYQTTIEVYVAATSSPAGALSLERYGLNGWQTVDTSDDDFTDPSSGAARSELNYTNFRAGRYRIFYDSTSGGASGAIDVTVKQNRK